MGNILERVEVYGRERLINLSGTRRVAMHAATRQGVSVIYGRFKRQRAPRCGHIRVQFCEAFG